MIDLTWISPESVLMYPKPYKEMLANIERAGRVCYQSKTTGAENTLRFITSLINRGHESVLEHESISMKLIVSRAVAMEVVRHRIGAYSMESTRYVNYTKKPLKLITPVAYNLEPEDILDYMYRTEVSLENYEELIEKGLTPEIARDVLPNNVGAELYVTYNIRQWRHFIKQRISKTAHPEIRYISRSILITMLQKYPVFFKDLEHLLPEEEQLISTNKLDGVGYEV